MKRFFETYSQTTPLRIFGFLILFIVCLSIASTVFLVQTKQDIRQHAAEPVSAQTSGKVMFGAWVGTTVDWAGDEKAYEAALGKTRKVRHWYWTNRSNIPGQPGIDGDPVKFRTWATTMLEGQILMLSFNPVALNEKSTLPNIINGIHDNYIKSWAQVLKEYGKEVWLRPMWEDNMSWGWWNSGNGPWDKKKNQYKQAFCHIKDIFTSPAYGVQTTNVKFVWSPNVEGNGANAVMDSYPGSSCVDMIGLDGYPGGGGRVADFYQAFKSDYAKVKATGKPILFAEVGYNNGAKTEAAEQDIANVITKALTVDIPTYFPDLVAVVWFNEPHPLSADLLNPVHAKGLAAFKAAINDPFYIGLGDLSTPWIPPTSTPALTGPVIPTGTPTPTMYIAPTNTPTPSTSGLTNGNFEDGLTGWTVPSWFANIVKADNTNAQSGSLSLHFQGSSNTPYAYQDVPVSAGKTVTLSGYAHITVRNNGGMALIVEVIPMNSYGGAISPTTQAANYNAVTNGWVSFSKSVVMPTGTSKVRINIKSSNFNGSAYVDTLTLSTN